MINRITFEIISRGKTEVKWTEIVTLENTFQHTKSEDQTDESQKKMTRWTNFNLTCARARVCV